MSCSLGRPLTPSSTILALVWTSHVRRSMAGLLLVSATSDNSVPAPVTFMGSSIRLSVFPGAAIFVTVLGYYMLGFGPRDLLDPRLRV